MTTAQFVEIMVLIAAREIKDRYTSIQIALKISNVVSLLLVKMHNRKEIPTTTYDYCLDILSLAVGERYNYE